MGPVSKQPRAAWGEPEKQGMVLILQCCGFESLPLTRCMTLAKTLSTREVPGRMEVLISAG